MQDSGKLERGFTVADLIPLDRYHYFSTDAAD
jgi:hypothetical protein